MKDDVNQKIIDNIEKADCDDEVRIFLKELFMLEFVHSNEHSWQFTKLYESLLDKHFKQGK